ncbi:Gfo/Idh/MocA family protein [Streptomyces sp. NPDC002403]
MKLRLRASLIGLGRMGRHHARVLRSQNGTELVGALDPHGDPYWAADGIPLVADLDALLQLDLDYAVLACPTLLHEPQGTALATAGIPTLIEKPLAGDPASAGRLAEAFHTAEVPAAVGYIERFNPALIALRQRLEAGQLGDVFSIATRRTGPYPVRITDVGVIHDLATHDLDLTACITGTRYASVAARTAHRSGRSASASLSRRSCRSAEWGLVTRRAVRCSLRTVSRAAEVSSVPVSRLPSSMSCSTNSAGGTMAPLKYREIVERSQGTDGVTAEGHAQSLSQLA